MPKVSVIIPVFRQAHYLATSLGSLLAQTHADWEAIIVDDGSPDDVATAAAPYISDERFRLIRQENRGLALARNAGIAAATGDYLCFLDADDGYAPTKLAQQLALLEGDPQVSWCYCDITTTDADFKPLADQFLIADQPRQLSGDLFGTLLQGGYFPPHTVMVRRAVIDKVGGFDAALGGHADYELWLRLAGHGHAAVFLPEPLALYRTHEDSMSKDGRHMDETRLATLTKIARQFPDRVGPGLHLLQHDIQNLFSAHQWFRDLRENAAGPSSGGATGPDALPENAEVTNLLPLLREAQRRKGQADQVAVWDSHIGGRIDRVLYLSPPVELVFRVPHGDAGTLITAICLHEESWGKPGAGGCEFHLRVDGRVMHVSAINPAQIPSDRRWHEIRLDVPQNDAGCHEITFETRTIGRDNAYRWSVWRAPSFVHVATDTTTVALSA
jgi:GT2 family glycosyltransferase